MIFLSCVARNVGGRGQISRLLERDTTIWIIIIGLDYRKSEYYASI